MALTPSWLLDDLMETIFAVINHNRWIAICPRCQAIGSLQAIEVKPGDIFVCPGEHPEILAKTFIPNPRMKGAFNSVPDEILREETRQLAIAQGNAYRVEFPGNAKQIIEALRVRPVHARNWEPGTTLKELRSENARNGAANA